MFPEYGIFALDPGGTTAWARGVVKDEGTVAERIEHRELDGSFTYTHPDWMVQARVIAREWAEFRRLCHNAGLPAYFVCEDFILTRMKSSNRVGLYPVWIAAAVVGYRNGLADAYELGGYGPAAPIETVWQQPGQAKGFCTDDRLRDFGLWVRGKEHERDAWRHFAFFIANEKSQKLRLARVRAGAAVLPHH